MSPTFSTSERKSLKLTESNISARSLKFPLIKWFNLSLTEIQNDCVTQNPKIIWLIFCKTAVIDWYFLRKGKKGKKENGKGESIFTFFEFFSNFALILVCTNYHTIFLLLYHSAIYWTSVFCLPLSSLHSFPLSSLVLKKIISVHLHNHPDYFIICRAMPDWYHRWL